MNLILLTALVAGIAHGATFDRAGVLYAHHGVRAIFSIEDTPDGPRGIFKMEIPL